MDLSESIKIAGIVASIISGIVGIFTFFSWWYSRVITNLENDVADSKRKLAEKQQLISELSEEARTAKMLRESADKELAVLQSRFGSLENHAVEVVRSKELAEKQIAEFKRIAEQKYSEQREKNKRELLDQKSTLTQQIAEKTADNDRMLNENAKLASERDSFSGKLDETRAKLATERKVIRETLKQQGKIWLSKVPKTAPRFCPLKQRKTVIIAVLNLKGGVGKTTITANLSGLLGSQGKRVLMIDLDHQRSLSRMLLSDEERSKLVREKKSIQTFFTGNVKGGTQLLWNLVKVEGMTGCELITNHDPMELETAEVEYGLEDLEMQMQLSWLLETDNSGDIRFFLREGLHSDSVANYYDYVFLDCPPRMSTACVNALAAADFVLIPVQGETVASLSVGHLLFRLRELRECGSSTSLRVLGVVGNLLHSVRDMESSPEVARLRDFVAELSRQKQWPEPVETFATVFPRDGKYLEATSFLGQGSELKLAIQSKPIRTLFEQLAKEIEDRIDDHRNTQ